MLRHGLSLSSFAWTLQDNLWVTILGITPSKRYYYILIFVVLGDSSVYDHFLQQSKMY